MEGKERKKLKQWVSEWVGGKNGKMARWQDGKMIITVLPLLPLTHLLTHPFAVKSICSYSVIHLGS
jgi:hypothetical protein